MTDPVVVCTWSAAGDQPLEETEAALTLGRTVSADLGVDLHWLVVGPPLDGADETAGRHSVAVIDRIDDPKLDDARPDAFVEALAQYCASHPSRLLVFNQNFATRLVAPRVAGRLDVGVVMNGTGIEVDGDRLDVTAAGYGGDTRVVYGHGGPGPCVVGLLANAVAPEPVEGAATAPTTTEIEVDLSGVDERIRVLEAAHTEGPRLEDAEIIVAGGRGLGAPENFKLIEELADVLGGMAGASRPLVDEGWIDSSRQVGLTGKITRPALYLAAGISGATQHMVGCSAAKTIVAINTDPDAAIFRHARYGIVGDCTELLPELIRAASGSGDTR
ncbi:MAG: electron transfer flavoprotein subunit alpha/FixB family protein [Acidimicrobiia bacterium]